jgi:hypothetical protein
MGMDIIEVILGVVTSSSRRERKWGKGWSGMPDWQRKLEGGIIQNDRCLFISRLSFIKFKQRPFCKYWTRVDIERRTLLR